MIKLGLPLRDILVTQPFGVNYVDFYQKLGLKGHNGIDFKTYRGCPVFAAHSGKVVSSGPDGTGGIIIEILKSNKGNSFKTIYYHLEEIHVKAGDEVTTGDLIASADNTGKYTTGDHLHFGLKKTNYVNTVDKDNGYRGGIDPAPYFPRNWEKTPAYHRYGRERHWIAEWKMRFKNAWLHRHRIAKGQSPIPDSETTNALVYGGWDIEAIDNIGMLNNWRYLKKQDYLNGARPFSK